MEEEERLNDSVPDSVIIEYLLKEKEEWQKEKKELEVQLGKERSYIQELEYKLEREKNQNAQVKQMEKDIAQEVMAEKQWSALVGQNKALRDQNKILKKTRDELLQKLNAYKIVWKRLN